MLVAARRYVSQAMTRAWQADRRLKLMLVMVVAVVVITRSSVVVVNFPRLLWLGADTCSVWRARHWAVWQQDWNEWWHKLCRLEEEMEQIDYQCADERRMGNRLVCFDNNLVPKDNCIVYSFGIAYDFRFDDAMADYGCTVYSFDPSMNVSDHKRGDRVYFKRTGLHSVDTDTFQPRFDQYVTSATVWRMRRLSSIMKELGHKQGSLTLVKVDIESYEWAVVKDMLDTEGLLPSIPQVLIEWHLFARVPPRSQYDDLVSIYFRFKDQGFRKFFSGNEGRNHYIRGLSTQRETSWVNVNFTR